MAARGIRDVRMGVGRPTIQPARPPAMGRPVISPRPMVRPVSPGNLIQPRLQTQAPISTGTMMPGAVGTPTPVNPAGPRNVQPVSPTVPKMRV